MNVTKNGYYTSQYLDERRDKTSHRNHYYHPSMDATEYQYMNQVHYEDDHHRSGGNRVMSEEHSEVPRSLEHGAREDVSLYSEGDPLSLTHEAETHISRRKNDPDYLEQGITPAQLNILQRRRNRHRYRTSTGDIVYSEQPAEEPQHQGYDGYYIDQKKRYEDSPYKPKMYTHKTFRDVFADSDEHTGKYNPMEFVFDEESEDKKLKKAFKTVQSKMGRPDYNDYDYYRTKEKEKEKEKSNPVAEIFVDHGSDDDSDSMYEEGAELYVNNSDANGEKKKKFRVLLKRRLKKAKKELGRDYIESTERQRQLKRMRAQKKKELKQAKIEELGEDDLDGERGTQIANSSAGEDVVDDSIVIEPEDAPNRGPREDFNPIWNYILSWLVYEAPNEAPKTDVNQNEMEKPDKPDTSRSLLSSKSKERKGAGKSHRETQQVTTRPQKGKMKSYSTDRVPKIGFKQLKTGYKQLKSKWNEPVTHLFNNDYQQLSTIGEPSDSSNLSTRRTLAPTIIAGDSESQEIVIELDDEEGEEGSYIDEELYFNPITKQLERTPPTSSSSLDTSATPSFFKMAMREEEKEGSFFAGMIDVSNGPRAIISNINSLIKNIKIMRIVFAPIDVIGETFPNLQTVVIIVELGIFIWILYELSLLVDALCMMVKAFCAPMIAMGRFMNRIM